MNATARFQFSAGALVRGQVERELQRSAFDAGLDIDIQKSGGWLDTDYRVTVTGEQNRVTAYSAAVSNWMSQISRG